MKRLSATVVLAMSVAFISLIQGCFIQGWAAYAIDPPGFTRKLWQTQDGLPEQTVQSFAQTSDRYLWIGTTGGLLRFDGARFVLFDHQNTPALRENSIFSLLASRDGSLWIGTEGGGLVRYRDGNFRAYSMNDGLTDEFVRALYEDRKGTIWVGTDNGLLRLAGDRLQRVDDTATVPQLAVHAIYEDHLGGLWAGGSRLLRFDASGVQQYKLPGTGSQNRVKSILEARDGTVWVGTVSGLNRMVPHRGPAIPTEAGRLSGNFVRAGEIAATVRVLRQTSDGVLWIGTIGKGMYAYQKDAFAGLAAPEYLNSNTVLSVFEDYEKNLWVGTQAGLMRLTRTPVSVLPLPQATDSDFGTIYRDKDDSLWVVSSDLFHLRNGVAVRQALPGVGRLRARNVFRDRSGALWVGTDGDGLLRIAGKQIKRFSTREGLVNNFIRAMLQARDGSMWIGTDEGVSHFEAGKFTNYQMREGLSYFSTRALLEQSNGDIWIGTDRGLSRLRHGRFLGNAATDALALEKVWAIHEDADGGLWFGTRNDGLYRWKQQRLTHYTIEQGLASNSIYQILEGPRKGFWLSGPNGISLLDRRQLDAKADHPSQRLSVKLYGVSDGVETAQIYGGRQPSGVLGSGGDVWFISNRGPVHIVSEEEQPPIAPPVVIDQVVADGRSIPAAGPITLGPASARLEISYAPVFLGSQDGLRFRYKLEGFDEKWVDAGSRRVASYTNLPAGKYLFRLAAFPVNDPDAVSEASISLTQRQHFYRTYWFVGCCLLLLAAALLAIYRLRLWQMKMRFQAVLEERARLAREMHDTVIQGCASVSALLEAMSSMDRPDARLRQDLVECARTQVRATIDEARRVVWNLRQTNSPEDMLGSSLAKMTEQISRESGVRVACAIAGKPFMLDQSTTHELMMVTREAVYNAVLHGQPANIEVSVCFAKSDLTLSVHDDGTGFDPSSLPSQPEMHYGLVGMRERIQAVGGSFQLTSVAGQGTSVRIEVPRRAPSSSGVAVGA